MKKPEETDDKYFPLSIRENSEWLITDLYIYISELEKQVKIFRKIYKSKLRYTKYLKECLNNVSRATK